MKLYDHKKIEGKWQKDWENKKIFQAKDGKGKKSFLLVEFPFPSGAGLHTGHIRSYAAMDIVARKHRMEGKNVLYPMGWDAFGLPTEQYAIKTGIQPKIVTKKNTDIFRKQLKGLGLSFDWSREVNTTDPVYYKWTQWIFLQFYKKGLAYKTKTTINWCPKDKIGLANEEVIDGMCERCGTSTEKREKEQWMLAITKYADRLDKDLDLVDFPERVKIQQRNWIGRSEGSEIDFSIKDSDEKITVFTTRADTLFGVTYVVLSPENPLVSKLKNKISNFPEVEKYISETKKKNDIERTSADKEKTGVELKNIFAINPANGETVPVWIADYVLPNYGTGAVMAVPAHDERDFIFAQKYKLPLKYVVVSHHVDKISPPREGVKFVPRIAVECYLRNPKTGEILLLEHKGIAWRTPVTGGVEKGEEIIEAGIREIAEETGYKNIVFSHHVSSPVRADLYHPLKAENRSVIFHPMVFNLVDDIANEIDEDELKKHTPIWISIEEAKKIITTGSGKTNLERINNPQLCYVDEGIIINSGEFDNLNSEEARKKIAESVGGKIVTKFKLRDWVFSRQRYWGEPIPIVHCEKCGYVPVPEKDLPVELPAVKSYTPTDNGESPLAGISKWVNTKCPKCKGNAKRETDTMPNWAGSSWYYLRYADPKNKTKFADAKKLKYWTPVDWYNGGMEHTTLHLLYSRFWHKFLYDLKLVPTKEPYKKRTSHGLILAEGGAKMSKSVGNVVNPDDIVKTYGADTLRLYEMFMGPFEQAVVWNTESIIGSRRFIERVWKLGIKVSETKSKKSDEKSEMVLHQSIKKVSEYIENMGFNTAVSQFMICLNELEKSEKLSVDDFKKFLQILAPFAPHVSEELWHLLGEKKSIHISKWPKFDPKKMVSETITIVIQVNSKMKGQIVVPADSSKEEIEALALKEERVQTALSGANPQRVIYVPGRLINFVV